MNSIITILTTAAVALHAMLGCCAHHAHDCCSSNSDHVTAHVGNSHCAHSHQHQHDDSENTTAHEKCDDGCGDEHHSGSDHSCKDGNCNFAAAKRTNEFELTLNSAACDVTVGDVAHSDIPGALSTLQHSSGTPPGSLKTTGSTRITTQVWRL